MENSMALQEGPQIAFDLFTVDRGNTYGFYGYNVFFAVNSMKLQFLGFMRNATFVGG